MNCITATRKWRDGEVVDTHVDPAELASHCADPGALVWVDLMNPSAEDLEQLAGPLGLSAAAIEDALAPHERPKFTRHEDHDFFTVYSTRLMDQPPEQDDHGRLTTSRISAFVLPHALITIRLDERFDMTPVVVDWDDSPHLLRSGGPSALVHGLLDVIVDGHFSTIQELDDQIEGLEDELFAEHRTGHTFLRQTYGLRKDLVALRRVVLPMREVLNGFLRHRTERSELDVWFDDLYDHVLRASEWTESLRDMVTTVFETNLSLQDSRLNQVMKKLAGWAAIIAVPTAITGWFGQNVPYLGYDQPYGVWLSLAMIVVISAILYWSFKARDWI